MKNYKYDIYLVGDSHVLNVWPYVIFQWLNGRTCYRFGKKNLKDYNLRGLMQVTNITDGDVIIFSVGEIDCSCHVHKYVSKDRSYQDVIDSLIKNYFDTVRLLVKDSGLALYVYIYNIVPPQNKDGMTDVNRPIVAPKEERLKFTKYFNKKAKEECAKNGFGFFDVYDKYADENGYLRPDLSDGFFHIANGKYIQDFLMVNLPEEIESGKVKLSFYKI